MNAIINLYLNPYMKGEKKINGKTLLEFKAVRRFVKANGRAALRELLIKAWNEKSTEVLLEALASVEATEEEIESLRAAVHNEWGFVA
jgi:hypothetical protein